jgi:diadenylate cyclase
MDQLLNAWVVREVIRPALDVLMLAYLLYKSWQILVQTRAVQLLKGTVVMVLIYAVSFFLQLTTLLWILNVLVPGLVIAIAIIFQPELRKIFTTIGQRNWFGFSGSVRKTHLESIINSVEVLAMKKVGSIIVLSRQVGLKNVIETGTQIGAELSSSLILTIFTENTPLHDGAIIIRDDRIVAAGCFLPLSEQQDIKKSFGTRHRAALGLSEESDAVIIVVSEETGAISLAYEAKLVYDVTLEFALTKLTEIFEIREEEVKNLEIEE